MAIEVLAINKVPIVIYLNKKPIKGILIKVVVSAQYTEIKSYIL